MEFSWETHENSPSRKQWSSPDNPDVCARVYSRGVSGQIEWELLFTNFPTRALYSCTVGSFCMHVAGSVLRMMRMSNVKFCCVVFFHITSLPIKWVAWEHVPCTFHSVSMHFREAPVSCTFQARMLEGSMEGSPDPDPGSSQWVSPDWGHPDAVEKRRECQSSLLPR